MKNENDEDLWTSSGSVKKVVAYQEGLEVQMQRHVRRKLHGWCKAARSEVSGVGLVRKEGNKFVIYDAFILPQRCSSGYTSIDDYTINKLKYDIMKRGGKVSDLRFWWHTHYNFSTFWSGTDVGTARRLAGEGDWFISTVINQKGDELTRLDLMSPVRIALDEIKLKHIKGPKRKKRNYQKDIVKYVKPMAVVKYLGTGWYKPEPKAPKVQTGFFNYAGQIYTLDDFLNRIQKEADDRYAQGLWDQYDA